MKQKGNVSVPEAGGKTKRPSVIHTSREPSPPPTPKPTSPISCSIHFLEPKCSPCVSNMFWNMPTID